MKNQFIIILFSVFLFACHKENMPEPVAQCGTPSGCPDITFDCNGATNYVLVDFEPPPFANLVQTCPHHLEKEPMGDAYISVRLNRSCIPWVIDFWSNDTDWASNFACMDEYTGFQQSFIFGKPDTLRLLLWDTLRAHEYLYTYEQMLVALEIKCGNDSQPINDCNCENLLTGYFEMEDCQVYLPDQQPFSCAGNDLEVAMNVGQHRVTFRSEKWTFCTHPIQLWTFEGPSSPTAPYSCEAEVLDAMLDFGGHELDLLLDEDFLLCAYEEEDGFWFSLAVE